MLLLTVLLLSACTPTTSDRAPAAYTTEEKVERAQALLRSAPTSAEERDTLLLEAGILFQEADYRPSALNAFGAIDPAQLPDPEYGRYTLHYAELALDTGDRATARALLTHPRITRLARQLARPERARWHEINGRLYSAPEESLAAARHYVAAAELADNAADQQRYHDRLWATLNLVPENELMRLSFEDPGSALAGWADLAIALHASSDSIDAQQQAFNQWRQRQPGHPASTRPPEALLSLERFARDMPRQVALLLPLSGPLADAGRAVRDGYLTAHYQALTQGGTPPSILLYDTHNATDPADLYARATQAGAEVVVGPLQKGELAAIARQPHLPTPLLGLNRLGDDVEWLPHDTFYQFGLPPEEEARQVARRAWHDGQRTMLIIAPSSAWGERTATAFREEWQELGGRVVAAPRYHGNQGDYSDMVRPALGIDESAARHTRLERTLGRNVAFSLTPRPDIDAVLLLAQPTEARQIKPTLDFFFAGDLPVYATSQIYSGGRESVHNRDLDGIRFTVEPHSVAGLIAEPLRPDQDIPRNLWSLHSLGVDAFHLHQRLRQMRQNPTLSLSGNSGLLRIRESGVVERELPWAEFRGGQIRPLAPPES